MEAEDGGGVVGGDCQNQDLPDFRIFRIGDWGVGVGGRVVQLDGKSMLASWSVGVGGVGCGFCRDCGEDGNVGEGKEVE